MPAWLKKRLGLILALVGAIAIAIGVWRWRATHKEPDVVYKTAAVEKRRIMGRVTASGTLSALVTVQVGSQVSGRLQTINVDYNSPVKKGQLIAKLDPQLFDAAVEQAQANYASAAAHVTQAKTEQTRADRAYERAKNLNKDNLMSQGDLETAQAAAETAKAAIDVAVASLEQARAALNQAKVNLSYTNIISPIDGIVISKSVDVGQTVAASLQAPVLFTIAEDLRKMQVDTNVSEGDVGRLQPGMKATFTVDAYPGQRFKGVIETIRNSATTVQNVVTYDAVIKVANDDLKLRPGMTANVTIVYAEKDDALAVQSAALRFRPPNAPVTSGTPRRGSKDDPNAVETKPVWVVVNNNVTAVQVKIGMSDGAFTEVTPVDGATLDPGMQVAIDASGAGVASAPATVTGQPPGGGRGRMF
jgi:HlyD family secretion protein